MYFNLVYSVSQPILLIYLLLFLFLFIFSLTFVLPSIKHTSLILLLESRISSQKLMPSFCPLNVTFLLLLTLALPFFVFRFIFRCLPIYTTIAYLYTHTNFQL